MSRKFRNQLLTGMNDKIISTNGRAISSIGIGSKVRLIGDENSPVMIVVSGVADNRGIQMGWACGWFTPGFYPEYNSAGNRVPCENKQSATWNCIQLATEAIELAENYREDLVQ